MSVAFFVRIGIYPSNE